MSKGKTCCVFKLGAIGSKYRDQLETIISYLQVPSPLLSGHPPHEQGQTVEQQDHHAQHAQQDQQAQQDELKSR